MQQRQQGFTLVEIAIVLVIIGLLLGAMLQGQAILTNARVKRVINDFENLSAAFLSYQDRYRQVPGDDNSANARWGASAANGNSNGVIEGAWNQSTGSGESRLLWGHLRHAGLIPGATSGTAVNTQPKNAYGGLIGIDSANLGITGVVLCQGQLPGEVAAIIDNQLDDGVSNTGRIIAALGASVDNNATPTASIYTQANENAAMTMCKSL